jgi:hypothetical protein
MSQNIYKGYSPEEMEDLFSNFLVDSWSYSKVTSFARNEKSFEMQYIFGLYGRSSATTVSGQAYHKALQYYFEQKKQGKELDIIELEKAAFEHIDEVKPNYWKLGKTTPTVEECILKANKTVAALLRNFMSEKAIYEDDLKEIIDIELYIDEFLTINGVDIPLPAHMVIDMVIRTKDNKLVVIDHKSKHSFTPDEESSLSIGVQAITYVKGYEEKTGARVDEVWFIENKFSTNKDGSPQLVKIAIQIDQNTRRLYEALLYEPLQRVIKAVSDPDYVYLINDSDNYTDKAELYDFWARTMISEVEDFNVEETKKELVAKRLKKIRDSSLSVIPPSAFKSFSQKASNFIQYDISNSNMTSEQKIEHTLRTLGMVVRVAHTFEGYSSNTYLIEVSAGVKVGSIYSKRLDIANALNVTNVRISKELVVYEGRSYVAVDFSKKREKNLDFDTKELVGMKIPLGKDNFGQTIVWDLDNQSTPHMLVCGSTGSGKSVFLESTIEYAKTANVDEVYIFDPKRDFCKLHDHNQVFVYNEIEEIEEQMAKLVLEMESLLAQKKRKKIVVVFDEFADAVSQSRSGSELKVMESVQVGNYANGQPKFALKQVGENKSLEENLRILLQKGRSSGFRIIGAMQRASVKVIGGDAKVNFPIQVCFRVPKEVDSKVVLDEPGAEALAGKGDGLIKSPEYPDTIRFQAFYSPKFQTA